MTEATHQHQTTVPPHHYDGAPQPKSAKGVSTAGMVLGICSIVFSVLFGFILGIMAIIFSAIGLKRQKNGLAIAGLVTGIIGLAIGLIFGFLLVITSYTAIQQRANESMIASDAMTVAKYAELYNTENDTYPSFRQMQKELDLRDGNTIVIDTQGSNSDGDIIYIPCYGDGAIIWYWASSTQEYKSQYVGKTNNCEWNE